jgi:Fic family protein
VEVGRLAGALSDTAFEQGEVAGALRTLGEDDRERAVLDTLAETAIETSQIEGERLTAESVRASLARRFAVDAAPSRDADPRADGIVAMTVDALQNAEAPLTKERLLRWHTDLFADAPRSLTVGEWRTVRDDPMQVVSGPVQARVLHFEAPPASRVDEEMRSFLEWFEAPSSLPPLVHAAVAHLRFLTIHPFSDGNGRVARAIADLRLARAQPRIAPYVSLSRQIRKERAEYYGAIERAQRGDADVTPWSDWFIGCYRRARADTLRSIDDLMRATRFWREHRDVELNARQRKVLERYLGGEFEGWLNSRKYAVIAKASPDTAQRDLADLAEKRIILSNDGKARKTSYRLADDFDPNR